MGKLISPVPKKEQVKKTNWGNVIGSFLRAIGQDVSQKSQGVVNKLPSSNYVVNADPTPTPIPAVLGAMTAPTASAAAIPTPTPPLEYRHPGWEKVKGNKNYQEMSSGTALANQKYPDVPQDLLMDISMIEAGGMPIQQYGGPAQGYYQFEPSTLAGLKSNIDPYSATESAELAAKLIHNKQLSRWGVPGGTWGSLDASRRQPDFRLSTYYSPEELNQFLDDRHKFVIQ